MRVLVQRVREAWVEYEGTRTPRAGAGLLALVGFRRGDDARVLEPMAHKLVNLRVLDDGEGRMNRSLLDCRAELVLVPQFTLYADCTQGRRPSFFESLEPEAAAGLYGQFVARCDALAPTSTGKFGAAMQVHLVNDGPVTILLDSDELRLIRPERNPQAAGRSLSRDPSHPEGEPSP
ncbi:MAG: D-tyrosyl-tRNA(Tyr) deacylase [Candidatus Lambdaproteobacteria bacterium]|nr:D-tyrosyl-tRNA(Tyr) deacylase [Candidatus Lambdaproteobacteria bacterium]